LRAALSSIEDHHNFALQLLFEIVWHQGTVYEASARVVPFLYRMLQAPQTPDRAGIAHLLGALADGHSYLQVHATRTAKDQQTWRAILAKDGRDLQTEMTKEVQWVQAARQAVGVEIELLYPYLNDEDATVRWSLAKAFAQFPNRAVETIPLLEAALAKETAPYTRQEIQVTLAVLKGEPSPLPKIRDASNEPVDKVNCPKCGSRAYVALWGAHICSVCGYRFRAAGAPD